MINSVEVDKREIVNNIVRSVQLYCNEFSTRPYKDGDAIDNYMLPLPVTKIEIKNILEKVVTAIPPYFFAMDKITTTAVCEYIAKEYVFFQVQEDITDKLYLNNLVNFINELKKDIFEGIVNADIINKTKKVLVNSVTN